MPTEDVPNPPAADTWSGYADDLTIQGVVIAHVVSVHPVPLTMSELVEQIGAHEAAEPSVSNAIERAARDLADVGLFHIRDETVSLTRAALRYTTLAGRL